MSKRKGNRGTAGVPTAADDPLGNMTEPKVEETWGHRAVVLLRDLISLHDLLGQETLVVGQQTDEESSKPNVICKSKLAPRLWEILDKGYEYDVPDAPTKPPSFLIGQEEFLQEEGAISRGVYIHSLEFVTSVVDEFSQAPDEQQAEKDEEADKKGSTGEEEKRGAQQGALIPGNADVRLLRSGQEDSYVGQADLPGNERLLGLVDQYVRVHSEKDRLSTLSSKKRAVAALAILDLTLEAESGSKRHDVGIPSKAQFVIALEKDGDKVWEPVSRTAAAEITLILLFQKFLERDQAPWGILRNASGEPEGATLQDFSKPGTDPIIAPEPHDVLFGRGGLTNNHPGNRRYRDIISLHRPDYVSAVKVEKPNVAKRIVRAIRTGVPAGRFLKKKAEDNMWYDVGDRHAAEKTSQALREKVKYKSKPTSDKPIKPGSAKSLAATLTANRPFASGASVGPYSMALREFHDKEEEEKEKAKEAMYRRPSKNDAKNGSGENAQDDSEKMVIAPVDEKGNIVVTDHDILCGRGGLTNMHKGNKRFRDIVSLHREDYTRASKVLKPNVARLIVNAIRQGDPPGRFLKKDSETGLWFDVGDKKAAEKCSQALREKGMYGGKDGSSQKDKASKAKKDDAVPIAPREASTDEKSAGEGKAEREGDDEAKTPASSGEGRSAEEGEEEAKTLTPKQTVSV